MIKKNFLYQILLFIGLFAFFQYEFALAGESIKIKAIKTEYGMKIYFNSKDIKYKASEDNGIITVFFDKSVAFENAKSIKENWTKISKVVEQENSLNIFIDPNNIRLSTFAEQNDVGIIIYDDQKQDDNNQNAANNVVPIEMKYIMGIEDKILIQFQWPVAANAAVYTRGNYLWIAFDQRCDFNVKNDTSISSPILYKSEENLSLFGIKIDGLQKKYTNIMANIQNNFWDISLGTEKSKNNEIVVLPKPYASPLPKVDLKFTGDIGKVLQIQDPILSDEIIVIPIAKSKFGISNQRKFIDFRILESAQGVVIKKNIDNIITEVKKDTVSIISDDKRPLMISVKNKNAVQNIENTEFNRKATSKQATAVKKSIASLMSVYISNSSFITPLIDFQHNILSEDNLEKRSVIRRNFAAFMLSNGFFQEARIILNSDSGNDNYIDVFLKSLTLFFEEKNQESYDLLKSIDLIDVPTHHHQEILFWQTLLNSIVNIKYGVDFIEKVDLKDVFLQEEDSFLSEYPDYLRIQIGFAIASQCLHKKNIPDAKSILKFLENIQMDKRSQNHINMLYGQLHSMNANLSEAVKKWDLCIEDSDDAFHRSSCIYMKYNDLYSAKKISLSDYKAQLENASIIWQGGDFERDTLKMLGDATHAAGDYVSALRYWKRIAQYYPYSAQSINLTSNIGETFIKLFTSKLDDNISNMQAVALFYEFEHLVPIGAIGDEIVIKFTDHLVALDLLDRAAHILSYQVNNRLKGYKREEVINSLASIYIKMNRPSDAIDAIRKGDLYEELPLDLRLNRRYIHAEALRLNHEYDKAILLLEKEEGDYADKARAEVYWDIKDWKNFNNAVEPQIYELRADPKALLDANVIKNIIRLIISYSMIKEYDLMEKLISDFSPRILAFNEGSLKLADAMNKIIAYCRENTIKNVREIDILSNNIDILLAELQKSAN